MQTPLLPEAMRLVYDDTTRELLIQTGSDITGNTTLIGPPRIAACLGRGENDVAVSEDGALKVADWGSRPISGVDAAGENTYALVVVAGKPCRYLHATCITQNATISIDGGNTDAFVIPAGTAATFPGLDIPAGARIMGRNTAAGSNYANLFVSIW